MTRTPTPRDASGGSTSDTTLADKSNNHKNETNDWKDFAVSLLTSSDPVMRIIDEQRMERLEQCRVLQQALRECREQHQLVSSEVKTSSSSTSPTSTGWFWFWNNKRTSTTSSPDAATQAHSTTTTTTRAQLEDFPMGIRMMRYFLWRDMPDDPSGRRPPCLREEHALWACRGVALQCGPDLIRLRDCFKEQGPERILSQGMTAYETKTKNNTKDEKKGDSSSENKNKFSCLDFQTKLGSCIGQNAKALEERVQKRQQLKQQSEMEANKKNS